MYKVLIVEDEEILRKGLIFMTDWLKAGCVVVGEAANGNDGLRQIQSLQPDIVITDIRMPFKDGLKMLEESINTYQYQAIIMSGYSEFAYAQQAIRLNVKEYLLKPVDFSLLYKALQKITESLSANQHFKATLGTLPPEVHNKTFTKQDLIIIPKPQTKYVKIMLHYIQDNYAKKISLKDLSDIYHLSTTYLNIKFKEETNYTFNDFLNRYRILQAVELLQQNQLKVYEVAIIVGFKDYKYFIQVFKKYVGCSPIKFIHHCSLV